MTATLTFAVDGMTALPPGMIASIVTYLERATADTPPYEQPAGVGLDRLRGSEVDRYLAIFRTLGERWLWWSRLTQTRDAVAADLDDPAVEAYAVQDGHGDLGLLDIDCRDPASAELVFLGLFDRAVGKGTGPWLIATALERARTHGLARIFVHTCTFDHPGALGFYGRMGFAPYKIALELVKDPRLSGILPADAGRHIPKIPPR